MDGQSWFVICVVEQSLLIVWIDVVQKGDLEFVVIGLDFQLVIGLVR